MMNNVILNGRIANDIVLRKTESGKQVCNVCLAIPKDYKNSNGEYDTNFVDIVFWDKTAQNIAEYSKKGDMIGVHGKLETRFIEDANGNRRKKTEIVGSKVSFLASRDNPNKKKDNIER